MDLDFSKCRVDGLTMTRPNLEEKGEVPELGVPEKGWGTGAAGVNHPSLTRGRFGIFAR
jgi:hypothetical protein